MCKEYKGSIVTGVLRAAFPTAKGPTEAVADDEFNYR